MASIPVWTERAGQEFERLRKEAERAIARRGKKNAKASKGEGLFKQVNKCVDLLLQNPRHPGLKTHKFDSIENPYDPHEPVFEAYAQNATSGAYRVFWCYGPDAGELTFIAITPHP